MHVLRTQCQVSVPFDAVLPLPQERMVRTVPRNGGSSVAVTIADFCNKIGTSRTSENVRLESAKWAKADIDQVAVSNRDFYEYTPITASN